MEENLMTQINEVIDAFNSIDDEVFEKNKNDIVMAIQQTINESDLLPQFVTGMMNLKTDHTEQEYKDSINDVIDELEDAKDKVNANYKDQARVTYVLEVIDRLLEYVYKAYQMVDYYDVHIQVEKCDPDAKLPQFAHAWDGGADVYANEDATLYLGNTKIIRTGIKVNVPKGWILSVRPRSGMSAKTGVRIANAPGTIDSGYLDEVGIIMTNYDEREYQIHKGDRIAQLVVERKYNVSFDEVRSVANNDSRENTNGDSGFGSTGV